LQLHLLLLLQLRWQQQLLSKLLQQQHAACHQGRAVQSPAAMESLQQLRPLLPLLQRQQQLLLLPVGMAALVCGSSSSSWEAPLLQLLVALHCHMLQLPAAHKDSSLQLMWCAHYLVSGQHQGYL
jgi:hypothetical protein